MTALNVPGRLEKAPVLMLSGAIEAFSLTTVFALSPSRKAFGPGGRGVRQSPSPQPSATPSPTVAPTVVASAPVVPAVPVVPPPATGFVARQVTQLTPDGQPYHFVGYNLYNADTVKNRSYSMASTGALDASLNSIGAD